MILDNHLSSSISIYLFIYLTYSATNSSITPQKNNIHNKCRYLIIYLSSSLSIYLSDCLSIYLTYSSINSSTMAREQYLYQMQISIFLSHYLSIFLSVYLSNLLFNKFFNSRQRNNIWTLKKKQNITIKFEDFLASSFLFFRISAYQTQSIVQW